MMTQNQRRIRELIGEAASTQNDATRWTEEGFGCETSILDQLVAGIESAVLSESTRTPRSIAKEQNGHEEIRIAEGC
jgi:hypothetical protein